VKKQTKYLQDLAAEDNKADKNSVFFETKIDYSENFFKFIPDITLVEYYKMRDEIFQAEQHLLRVMSYKFSSDVRYVYLTLLNSVYMLELPSPIYQMSWSILNDCYEYIPQLMREEENINVVVSCVYLAVEFQKRDIKRETDKKLEFSYAAMVLTCEENEELKEDPSKFNYGRISVVDNWWWHYFNISDEKLSEISQRILKIYEDIEVDK